MKFTPDWCSPIGCLIKLWEFSDSNKGMADLLSLTPKLPYSQLRWEVRNLTNEDWKHNNLLLFLQI